MLILISDAFDDALPKLLSKHGEVTDDKGRLPEADIVLVRSKTKCTKEWIDQATNLKLIIRGGVGMDNIDREYAASKGIKTVNTAAASAIAVAELAMTLMLAAPHHLIKAHKGLEEKQWLKKQLKRSELYKKTLGLIGLGNIGTEVAKRAKAFGMDVIYFDVIKKEQEFATPVDSVDELLARADFISLHVPLTDQTNNMINSDAFAKMKDGIIIVNTGRAKCVNEEDMAAALKSGKVAYYATDVWYSDPPDDSCPLFDAPNVIMTPHYGAGTKENMGRIGEVADGIIADFLK